MNRKLIPLLFAFVALFTGCEGPAGPQGPAGADGSTVNVVGTTFDFVDVDFTSANDYSAALSFDDADIEVLESDAVLVYIHWDDQQIGNETVATYRLLPQTAYFDNGDLLTYNFDRTDRDFSVFLDGTVNLATLAPAYVQDQRFRVIVVPADFAARTNGKVDYKDYDAVVKYLNIDESKIRTVSKR